MATESNPNDRSSLYKKRGVGPTNQAFRRAAILQNQRSKREKLIEKLRKIGCSDDLENLPAEEKESPSTNDGNKKKSHLGNYLMLSEWMSEKPSDLHEKWIMVVCPVGKRCLVVARNASTKVFSKSGRRMMAFRSYLPGGGLSSHRGSCILDCIFSTVLNKFFVLDLLSCNSQSFVECTASDRFLFLSSKLREFQMDETVLNFCVTKNIPPFEDVTKCIASTTNIQHAARLNYPYEVDGLLFYHKEGFYLLGEETPTVAWLKPDMLYEVVGPLCEPSGVYQNNLQ